jgi:hypothetical protein
MPKENFKMLSKKDDADIIDFFEEIYEEKGIPFNLKFEFQSNTKLKQLIKLIKIPDQYSVIMSKDVLVQFNTEYFDLLDDEEIKKILIEQEIDRIEYNLQKGTWKLGSYGISTNFGMVDKWSSEKVIEAIEAEKLLEEQLREKKKEEKGQ